MSNLGFYFAKFNAPRSVPALSQFKSRWGTRNLHKRRALLYPLEKGLGDFLPPTALKSVAIDYQQGLLDRLNEEVRETEEADKSVVQTVINTAPHREKTLAFNYASLALNNSFFLDHLKPPPAPPALNHQHEISTNLGNAIRMQHGSIAQLKSAFSSAAMGLFISGWVWFVTDKNGNTGILPTFGPGTLLIRSRSYMANSKGLLLGEDLAQLERGNPLPREGTEAYDEAGKDKGSGSEFAEQREPTSQPLRSPAPQPSPPGVSPSSSASGALGSSASAAPNRLRPRFFHSTGRSSFELDRLPLSVWGEDDPGLSRTASQSKVEMLNIGEVLYPLFCVSVNEHAWMSAGYGVWGKEDWLKKFWTVLNWEKVSTAYEHFTIDKSQI